MFKHLSGAQIFWWVATALVFGAVTGAGTSWNATSWQFWAACIPVSICIIFLRDAK